MSVKGAILKDKATEGSARFAGGELCSVGAGGGEDQVVTKSQHPWVQKGSDPSLPYCSVNTECPIL